MNSSSSLCAARCLAALAVPWPRSPTAVSGVDVINQRLLKTTGVPLSRLAQNITRRGPRKCLTAPAPSCSLRVSCYV